MFNQQEINQNLNAVRNAIAQQWLEGLDVPPDVVADMQRAARGEIRIEEGIRNPTKNSRMTMYEGQDFYLDPETDILKNRFGIIDEGELAGASG